MRKIQLIYLLALLALVSQGCKKDLNVEYENDPGLEKVFATGEDIEGVVATLFNTYYMNSHNYNSIAMPLATASDHSTCSWGNSAMRDMSYEPRNNGWNNSDTYSYQAQTYNFFNGMYSAISSSTQALQAINSGIAVGANGKDNARAKAICKFIQGIAYANLALVFDKSFLVDDSIQITTTSIKTASSYSDIAKAAVGYLDEAIALSSANTFTIPASWLGLDADMSSADFTKLANTYAAKTLAYLPRNKTELAAVNWTKVKTYADAGVTSDFNILFDNNIWYDEAAYYLLVSGWGLVDMYVVHMMDPDNQPQHWDDNASFPLPAASTNPSDKRLLSDFEYVSSTGFQAARGYYHFSNYRIKRYDVVYTDWIGNKPEIMKAENDLLKAEARAYLNDLPGAAGIINAGTRVTRGKLGVVSSDNQATIIDAIHHERAVELFLTGMGLPFFEMRKLDLLQKGTPLHIPLPGKTIALFPDGVSYTFGYLANADGIGTSNKGWR